MARTGKTENLTPLNKRSPEELKKITSAGGKASAKARKKRKAIKEQMEMLMALPLTSESAKKKLKALGIDEKDMDNQMAVCVAIMQKMLKGDMAAVNKMLEITGEKVIEVKVNTVTDDAVKAMEDYLDGEKQIFRPDKE